MTKDDSYWLKVAYGIFAVLVFYTMTKAMNTLGVQTGWADRFEEVYPSIRIGVSVLVAAVSTFLLANKPSRNEYFLSSIGELRKVSWPTLIDTRRMTTIVCVVVGIFAVILAIFDFIWAKLLGLLIS